MAQSSTGGRSNQVLFVSAANPGSVNDATAQAPLGAVLTVYDTLNFDPGQHSRTYRYVQVHSGATVVKGGAVVWQDYINNVVTSVGSTALQNTICGVLQSTACTAGNYTWILVAGPGIALVTAGQGASVVIGQNIIASATVSPQRLLFIAAGTAPTSGPYGFFTSTGNAVVNGSAALGTDICAAYFDFRPRFDF